MLTASNNDTSNLCGEYQHGVDEKRRLQVPAKWRASLPEPVEYTLVLWPHGDMPDACLMALTPGLWQQLVDQLKAMPFMDPKAQALRRWFGQKSFQVTLDKSGRFVVPEEMAKAAGIEKEAMFVGMVDRFAIWNPERYAPVRVQDLQNANAALGLLK